MQSQVTAGCPQVSLWLPPALRAAGSVAQLLALEHETSGEGQVQKLSEASLCKLLPEEGQYRKRRPMPTQREKSPAENPFDRIV